MNKITYVDFENAFRHECPNENAKGGDVEIRSKAGIDPVQVFRGSERGDTVVAV